MRSDNKSVSVKRSKCCNESFVYHISVLCVHCTLMIVMQVPKLAQELSDLVTYCQAARFRSFDYSHQNGER